jgi:hypothetical protein
MLERAVLLAQVNKRDFNRGRSGSFLGGVGGSFLM